jgi:hypothetical protein
MAPRHPRPMILFEEAAGPAVRAGEFDLGGRRVAVRAFAYAPDTGLPLFRFDPFERRLVTRPPSGSVLAGPPSRRLWAAALARPFAGPALVEGGPAGEAARGAYRAAFEGALDSGRGVYLLDPPPAALASPDLLPAVRRTAPGPPPAVALFSWSPHRGCPAGEIRAASLLGIPAGVLWPVIPGWTAEPASSGPLLAAAAAAGASFALAMLPTADAGFRRAAVEARMLVDPGAAEAFFDTMHHSGWEQTLSLALGEARQAASRAGLAPLPPRPAAPGQPPTNALAASRLEEAACDASDEHRASRLQAAVRWIDACGRDLAAVLREGNFGKAFPFGPELAREAEAALREALA